LGLQEYFHTSYTERNFSRTFVLVRKAGDGKGIASELGKKQLQQQQQLPRKPDSPKEGQQKAC